MKLDVVCKSEKNAKAATGLVPACVVACSSVIHRRSSKQSLELAIKSTPSEIHSVFSRAEKRNIAINARIPIASVTKTTSFLFGRKARQAKRTRQKHANIKWVSMYTGVIELSNDPVKLLPSMPLQARYTIDK